MEIPMNVVMLGNSYQYPFAPMGEDIQSIPLATYNTAAATDTLNTVIPAGYEVKKSGTGIQLDTTGTRVLLVRSGNSSNVVTSIFDSIGKVLGVAQTALAPKPASGYTGAAAKTDYMPYILIGGAALAAVLLISGTRKRA